MVWALLFPFSGFAQGRFTARGSHVYQMGTFYFQKDSAEVVHFLLDNTGDSLLTVSSVIPSCNCMKVQFSKDPVPPGESGELLIRYQATHPGHFKKMITVVTDGAVRFPRIYVEGTAAKKEDESQ